MTGLLPLIDADTDRAVAKATEVLEGFSATFEAVLLAGMRSKLGLEQAQSGDAALVEQLLAIMQLTAADFTQTFRGLCALAEPRAAVPDAGLCNGDPAFNEWLAAWQARGEAEKRTPRHPLSRMAPSVSDRGSMPPQVHH